MKTYQIELQTELASEIEMFLSMLKVFRFVREVREVRPTTLPISHFRGILPPLSILQIDQYIENIRNEWERNI